MIVVGHGKSLYQKGFGCEIDKRAPVVRFSGRSWQAAEDYGERTDYIFTTSIPVKVHAVEADGTIPNIACCIWNRKSRDRLNLEAAERLSEFKSRIIQPFVDWMQSAYRELDPVYPFLSRGTVAILWSLITQTGDVTVVGCDNLISGDSKNYANKPPFCPYDQTHDYDKEREILIRWVDELRRGDGPKLACCDFTRKKRHAFSDEHDRNKLWLQ